MHSIPARLVAIVAVAALPLTALPFTGAAQNPVADALRARLAYAAKNFPATAETMPAAKYGFKPTPGHMSFAQHMVHMADFNEMMCALVSGSSAPAHDKVTATSPRDAVIAHVKRSFDFCTTAFASLTDANLAEPVQLFGSPSTKANAAIILATDWSDHYAVTATYLRLNGLLPPTARR